MKQERDGYRAGGLESPRPRSWEHKRENHPVQTDPILVLVEENPVGKGDGVDLGRHGSHDLGNAKLQAGISEGVVSTAQTRHLPWSN